MKHTILVLCVLLNFSLFVSARFGDKCRTNSIEDPHRCFVNMICDGIIFYNLFDSFDFNLHELLFINSYFF